MVKFLEEFMAVAFGLAGGSFLGVVLERSNSGHQKTRPFFRRILGRSRCRRCRHQLSWWENIPVFSFVVLGGRCVHCHSPIPYWLPLIEAAGAVGGIWTLSVFFHGGAVDAFGIGMVAVSLAWVFFSDLVYGVVPDPAVIFGSIGALIYRLGLNPLRLSFRESFFQMADLLWISLLSAGFFLFLVKITRGKGMGSGDVTLAFLVGLLLGWPLAAVAIWIAFVSGAAVGALLLALKRRGFGETIPFGPFLVAGTVVAFIWGRAILDRWVLFIVK